MLKLNYVTIDVAHRVIDEALIDLIRNQQNLHIQEWIWNVILMPFEHVKDISRRAL